MKILRVTSLGYEGGGAENGIVIMQPVLQSLGHEVRIFASDLGDKATRFSDYEFKAFDNAPTILKPLYRAFYPGSYRELKKVLKEYKPDIVQVHTMNQLSPSVLFALRGYPAVVTVHGAEDFTPRLLLWALPPSFFWKQESYKITSLNAVGLLHYLYHRTISTAFYRVGFANIERFIVFSRFMQKELQREYLPSTYIANATDLFESVPFDPSKRSLLFVGRLEKVKGVQDAICAMPKILETFPDTMLRIAGDGSYEKDLRALVIEKNLQDSVLFLGKLDRRELEAEYARCTIVLMPSIWPEAFGKVGIEAMSMGRPVIACDVGGVSEWLLDSKVGFLVPSQNPLLLAQKVIVLFTDTTLLATMGQSAALHARQFGIEIHAKKIVSLYGEVIASFRQRSLNGRNR